MKLVGKVSKVFEIIGRIAKKSLNCGNPEKKAIFFRNAFFV